MSNPQSQGIPGMDAMNDTLDFVKNLWGNMGNLGMSGMKIPGMIMPTLSVEEINKQIADLKTVESWLTLNMNMLRSTIQALEVQSATISTLQAMGDSLSAAVKPAPKAPAREEAPPRAAPEPEPESESEPEPEKPKAKPQAKAQAEAASLPNPAIWWNMLQDQFKQAVGNAMATDGGHPESATPPAPAKPAKAAPKAAAKRAPKAGAARSRKAPGAKAAKSPKTS